MITIQIYVIIKRPGIFLGRFLVQLYNPVRNALLRSDIDTLQKLSTYTEREILKLHRIGKASLPIFRRLLAGQGLAFKNEDSED